MRSTQILVALACLTALAPGSSAALRRSAVTTAPTPESSPTTTWNRVALHFEPNLGQTDPQARFLARSRGFTAFFTDTGVVFSLHSRASKDPVDEDANLPIDILRMDFPGSGSTATLREGNRLPGKSNYFIGNDPEKWVTGVPQLRGVSVRDLYPGVDLRWHGEGRNLAYRFEVAPGADPSAITLRFDGARAVEIEPSGQLAVQTERGTLRHTAPVLFQEVNGRRTAVRGGFVRRSANSVGFDVGAHDARLPLVIDPVLRYSTYLGGTGSLERAMGIAVDSLGAVYVSGRTGSPNFPTRSPFQSSIAGAADAFVAKINAAGNALVFASYLGGSSEVDQASKLAIDGGGALYVTGRTHSTDFPTSSAAQSTYGGQYDAWVAKINAAGSSLVFSTYLGGSGEEWGLAIAIDGSGNAYVTGFTKSTNFPTQSPLQSTHGGGSSDAFITKLSSTGSSLVYSTYLGGSDNDTGWGIAVNGSGAAYVSGKTASTNFPTQSAYDGSHGGGTHDAFVTKLNAAGSALVYSTYLGGSGNDAAKGIALDSTGAAYVTGGTSSSNFPTRSAAQSTHGGGTNDAFVTKFNAAGSALVYSTYLGGSGNDEARNIAVDGSGRAYVVGRTSSTNFPTQGAAQSTHGGGTWDVFVSSLNSGGSALDTSTYLGGSGDDFAFAVATHSSGKVFVCGYTTSTDFPSQSAIQATHGGGTEDTFVTSYAPPTPPAAPTDLTATVISDGEVSLSWTDASSNETGFDVERALGGGEFVGLAAPGEGVQTYVDTTAAGASTSSYRVRATNAFGSSGWSDIATATTPSPAPTNVSGASSSNRSVTLTWSDDADDETGYVVERAEGCPGEDFVVIAVLPPNSTSYTDRTVRPETTYSYRVRTRGSTGDSRPSLEVCVTTGPADPTNLIAFTRSDTAILLRWTDMSAVETAFEIERRATAGGTWSALTSIPGNTTEHVDPTVSPETEYTYRVRTVSEHGGSEWAPRVSARTAPAAPSDPFGEAVSSSRALLTWTDNSAVESGFEVRRRIHGDGGEFALVKRVPPNTSSFLDEGLLQETSYDYAVNSYDSAGDSNSIEIADLETTAALVIRKVKSKAAKKKKPAQMTVLAEIDFGGYQPDAADGVTIGVNDADLAVPVVKAKKKGRVLSGEADEVSFTLSRRSPTASRGSLKIRVSGDAAELTDGAELTISFTIGEFTAAGTIVLASGRFDLKKRVGLRIDPDVVPSKLKLKLGGLENDVLQLAASFESRAVPDEQPNALIYVGDTLIAFDGVLADVSGGKVTYRLEGLPQATLTVDYDKGDLRLKAKKLELGDYDKGDVPTLLDIIVGNMRWRDVPILRSTGRVATY